MNKPGNMWSSLFHEFVVCRAQSPVNSSTVKKCKILGGWLTLSRSIVDGNNLEREFGTGILISFENGLNRCNGFFRRVFAIYWFMIYWTSSWFFPQEIRCQRAFAFPAADIGAYMQEEMRTWHTVTENARSSIFSEFLVTILRISRKWDYTRIWSLQ